MEYLLEYYVVTELRKLRQGQSISKGLPPESIHIDGIEIGSMFTSHGEDVHLRVGPLTIPSSRGPNES